MQTTLPSGCKVSNFTVHPKDWKTTKDYSGTWYISYRFHDPRQQEEKKKTKQVIIKGMNQAIDVVEKRRLTKAILADEEYKIKTLGYNPITNQIPQSSKGIINRYDTFIDCLEFAQNSINAEGRTKTDIESVIKYVKEAIVHFSMARLQICDVDISHIKIILNYLYQSRKWSNNTYNVYRSYLMILFKELREYGVVSYNYPRDLAKKKTIKKARLLPTNEQRIKISKYWKEYDYRFWLYMNIFFHSGGRSAEFRRLQLKDINLENQTYKAVILKGKTPKEVWKPIKDIAVKYWVEYIGNATNKELYFLSQRFSPGVKPLSDGHITKHWRRHIKTKLGVEVDFYDLKRLNTDEVAASLSLQDAKVMDSHDSISTTKIYALNEELRAMERIKKVANEFQ
ncbi:tyrosine-type recombinase/integrase [Rhizosphaericola mali]|uniref:Phage integrase family protein n=1 Tax=Rhizosphaericola mali TaxID=2545455 RepID=A0A5P2G073_9BACT|nr:tyrosine-type recombinase/integrase [Rhizosphaericola mali]QES88885.1 phage integrase family protein [Rhizosphaericola mali]